MLHRCSATVLNVVDCCTEPILHHVTMQSRNGLFCCTKEAQSRLGNDNFLDFCSAQFHFHMCHAFLLFQFGANVKQLLNGQRISFEIFPSCFAWVHHNNIVNHRMTSMALLFFNALISISKSLEPMFSCTSIDGSLAIYVVDIAISLSCFTCHLNSYNKIAGICIFPSLI